MIGYLKGRVVEAGGKSVLVDVGGVGYRVVTNAQFQTTMEKAVELYVHTYVRDDEISLYGFVTRSELRLFELLIGVSGVGPKMAMSVLSRGKPESVQRAVTEADVGFFTGVSGIGKKNAQRIIVDLGTKLGSVTELDLGEVEMSDELVQALVGMGFERRRAAQVLGEIDGELSEGERLKLAIRKLS